MVGRRMAEEGGQKGCEFRGLWSSESSLVSERRTRRRGVCIYTLPGSYRRKSGHGRSSDVQHRCFEAGRSMDRVSGLAAWKVVIGRVTRSLLIQSYQPDDRPNLETVPQSRYSSCSSPSFSGLGLGIGIAARGGPVAAPRQLGASKGTEIISSMYAKASSLSCGLVDNR